MARPPLQIPDPGSPRRTLWLGVALIALTAVAALLVLVLVSVFTAAARTPVARSASVFAAGAPAGTSRSCPRDDRGPPAPEQVRDGARRMLVPPGVVSLRVCRYNGMNASAGVPQWGLRGAGVTSRRSRIARIVSELDAIRPSRGSYSCPFSDASDVIASFAYRSPPRVVVTVDTGGCNAVTNGHVRRLALGRPAVALIESVAAPVTMHGWPAVVGHVRLCGGPAPGRCWIQDYGRGDRVMVRNATGAWLALAAVSHGRFRFRIAAAGDFTFALYAGNTLLGRLHARAAADGTTRIVFTIPVP